MRKIQGFFHNQSLRVQLITWFLVIALIPLAWITFVTYKYALNTLQTQAEKHLKALVIRQVNLLNVFLSDKKRVAARLADETLPPFIESTLEELLKKYGKDSPEYNHVFEQLAPLIQKQTETLSFENFLLIDDDGTVVLSFARNILDTGSNVLHPENEFQKPFKELFIKTVERLQPQISSLFFLSKESPLGIFLSAPILDHENKLLGILFFQISNYALYQPIQNFHGLGQTGETIIATIVDSKPIVYSHENRNFPLVYRINPDSPFGQYVKRALNGDSSINYVKDFRGKETIVIGQKINPTANWVVITKVDWEEIINTFSKLKYFSWILLSLTAVFVTFIASYVARKISEPITMLTKTTKLMTAGNLNQRIDIPYHNELGKLGTSFNEMASQLDHIIKHLDSLVADRTREIKNKNIQLNQTIQELKETQSRLVEQEKLASLGALTAGIAHEIKNPLNFINNFAELSSQIQKDLSDQIEKVGSIISPQVKEELNQLLETLKLNLEKICKHGKRADSIVRNMLQHSRNTPGDKDLIDINKLLEEYVDLAYHGMRAKDATFNVKIEKNLASTLPKIYASPQEISRVFLNLLNNSFYATNQRKKHSNQTYNPVVKIITEESEGEVIIKIRDNGIGIPKNIMPKLFTPFFTTKPTGEGTGLGLSLSYNIIVQGHNGKLTAESEEGSYAEFTIRLPKKQD